MSLDVNQLFKTYGKKVVLNNVSISFDEQKIYGLLGNNGAGKSTLLNIINNRIFTTTGEVRLSGDKLSENEKLLNKVHLMSEDNLFPSKLKIEALFKLIEKFYGSFDWSLSNEMIKEFELDESKALNKLSTGYRSITKLIVALCVPSDYIFLDEPVLGLDTNHRELFYNFLIDTYQERPRTFVISTHLIDEISNLLEKVIILDKGKVINDEEVEALLKNTHVLSGPTKEVEALLGTCTVLKKEKLGGSTTAYTKGKLVQANLDKVNIKPMSLQEYFMKITSRKTVK